MLFKGLWAVEGLLERLCLTLPPTRFLSNITYNFLYQFSIFLYCYNILLYSAATLSYEDVGEYYEE